jgi:hypothetical protein
MFEKYRQHFVGAWHSAKKFGIAELQDELQNSPSP